MVIEIPKNEEISGGGKNGGRKGVGSAIRWGGANREFKQFKVALGFEFEWTFDFPKFLTLNCGRTANLYCIIDDNICKKSLLAGCLVTWF